MSHEDGRICDLLVIGGGASGMTCAIAFARECKEAGVSADIVILEKNDRIGKKVLATGNGRCNLGNLDMEMSHFHSHRRDFPKSVLSKIPQQETLSFLSEIGIVTVSEGKKLFPMSKTSSSVVDAYRYALDEYGIAVVPDAEVTAVRNENVFTVMCTGGKCFSARKLVIASGGACAPILGTTGDGYRWLSELGHRVYAPKPSIVQLVTDNHVTKALAGLKLDADLCLLADGIVVANHYGEVLFTSFGLSGPAVFQVSGEVGRRTKKGRLSIPMKVSLRIFDESQLLSVHEEMLKRKESMADRPMEQLLLSILPAKIGFQILKSSLERPLSVPISTLTDSDIRKIENTMRAWDFEVIGTQSLEYAQTTIGGADCEEFSEETLESLRIPGLYCCGEVLDVDGDCGGYNLQWAFSSGILVGRSVADAFTREKGKN